MADIITRLKFETDEFSNKARRMTTEINDITHKMEVAGNAVAHTNSRNLKLAQSFGTVQTASTTLRGKISELQDSFIAWGHHYNQLTEQQKRDPYGLAIVRQLEILKQRIKEAKGELNGLEGAMGSKNGSDFLSGMGKGLVPGFGMGIGAAGAMFAVRGVQAAAGLAKDAIKYNIETNMEFEQSNANLSAVLGKTRDEMAALTENAKMLGASTLFTANQITELQTVLARRGFNEDQILQMTHGISNLALATGTSLADAAELAGATMQSFGMKAHDMERIVSVLGVSTTKSALTMEKLGTSLQYVAPTARAAGFSLEDTVAMLGKLVDGGLDASTAGTSLRQIILAMSTDNGKLARSFGRPVRGINDFVEALEHVSNAEDLLSDASKEVRVTAVPALISLANSRDGLVKLRDELDNVGGKLQEMADKQASTLTSQITLLKSAWDGFMINLGNSEGTLKKAVQWMQELVSGWSKAVALTNGAESAIAAVYGGPEKHKWTNDPGENYLKMFNQYKESGRFDKDEKGKKYTEQEQADAINKYIHDTLTKKYEGLKAATDKNVDILDEYIKRSDELVKVFSNGKYEYVQYNVAHRNDILKLISQYDTKGRFKDLNLYSDNDDVIRAAAALLGQQRFRDSYTKAVADYAEQSMGVPLEQPAAPALSDKTSKSSTSHVKNPWDDVVAAEEKYARTYALADMQLKQGLKDELEVSKAKLGAEEALYNDYYKIYQETDDPKYLEEMDLLAEAIKSWREIIKDQEEELKKQQQQRGIYNRALRSIESTARGNNIRYADIGVAGYQELINNNKMTDGMMEDAVKKLNEQLKTKGIRWTVQLDLETGTLEKLKSRLDEVFEGIGKGTGGVKNIVGAIDSIKKAGESMVDTLRGDADGWDKMIAVLNAAMSPLEATVTIYEAINALTEMGNILKAARVASKTAEAAAEVKGTQAEVAAETEKIAVDKAATKAATELATAEYMAAHAAIPFTGFEIGAGFAEASLAVIKATGAAVLAFHDGGRVPGAYNGGRDTVPALLSPGEIILNRAQQNTLAPQLVAPKWGMDGGSVQFIQRGTDLIGVINATVASKGGVKTHKIYQH